MGAVRAVLVATPGYLDKVGRPQTPQELSNHSLITSSAVSFGNNWRFSLPGGTRPVRIDPRLRVTSNSAAITAATSGTDIYISTSSAGGGPMPSMPFSVW